MAHASAGRGRYFFCGGGLGGGQLLSQAAMAARNFSPQADTHLLVAAGSCPLGQAWEQESTAVEAFDVHVRLHCSCSLSFGGAGSAGAATAGSASNNPPITAAHHHEALFLRFMARISSR